MEGGDSANGIKSEPGLCISGDLCRLSQRSLRPPALSHGNSPLPFWLTACLLKKIMHQMIGSSATTLLHTNLHFCTVLVLLPPSIASSICSPFSSKIKTLKPKPVAVPRPIFHDGEVVCLLHPPQAQCGRQLHVCSTKTPPLNKKSHWSPFPTPFFLQ